MAKSDEKISTENAAKLVTMLLKDICHELDEDNQAGYAKAHPEIVIACLHAAAMWQISEALASVSASLDSRLE